MRGDLMAYNNNPNRAVQLILEDISGGAVIQKDELKNGATGMLSEGILISLDSNKIGHLTKTCRLWNDIESSATGIRVYKSHEFKVGDIVINTIKTATARNITAIDTSAISYDQFTIGSGFGVAIDTGAIFIEALASGVSGTDASYKYSPDAVGVSEFPINLQFENSGFGLLVRGRVCEAKMPYPVDATLKALFPLIRFV